MIASKHWQEWKKSVVDDSIISLNVISIFDENVYEYLLYGLPPSERRNDGRLRDKWLRRYAHLASGGWWVSGLDPLNDWQPMLWGRFKPDEPRIDESKNQPIRYESPPKVSNRVTYFDVTPFIWDRVAQRYGIKRYHSPLALRLADKPGRGGGRDNHLSSNGVYSLGETGEKQSLLSCLKEGIRPSALKQVQNRLKLPKTLCFWEWVQLHPEIPIIFTEGEKKAACLLSLGFVAIALPGIWNGRVKTENCNKYLHNEALHPDLMPMAQRGRKFIILFDKDEKPKTRYAVYQATIRTGKTIEVAGCECEVALLPGPEKGVDDFVAARGESAGALLTKIIDDAYTLKDYQRLCFPRKRGLSNKYPPNVKITTRFLSNAVRLPQLGLVAIWSGMGTGKTQLMARFRELYPEMRFLNCGHRVNLLKNLSKRLKTEMYSALSMGDLAKAMGLSITVDSLYKLQTELNEYGCVFIDEACQYLTHLLHSKTCKEHRAEILEVLEYIIRKAKLVVLADAHMDDVTVDFFRAMRPADEVPFIIKNDYKEPGRTVYLYEGDDSSALVAKIYMALMLGLKIMVVSDSKKFIKKLEAAMTVKVFDNQPVFGQGEGESESYGDNKIIIWSIHAENSGSEENIAFIKDISSEVKNVDALLASPSLGTGVDIPDYHFDAVFGVFHGVSLTATDCAQSLHRYRPHVPLHIWVAPRPPFGYKETNPHKIKERMLNLNEMTAFLIRIDPETGKRGAEKDWALDAYCQIEANRNRSINNLRDDLRSLLTEMEYNIIPIAASKDKSIATELKEAANSLDTAHIAAVVRASDITLQEYQNRQSKDYLQPEEVFECEKYRIKRDYGMSVTEELVERDDRGNLIRKLIALEATIAPSEGEIVHPVTGKKYPAPPQIVAYRDLKERDYLPISMDWSNYSAKWLARYILGVPQILERLLAGEELCNTDPDLIKMRDIALASRAHLKAILGFTVPEDCSPMWLLGTLLDQLALKLISHKKGARGQQVRYYSLALEELAFAVEILEYREGQRQEKADRERERREEQARYQASMESLYGIDPPAAAVSTPPKKEASNTLRVGVDTNSNSYENEEQRDSEGLTNNLSPLIKQFKEVFCSTIELGWEVLRNLFENLATQSRLRDCYLLLLIEMISSSKIVI